MQGATWLVDFRHHLDRWWERDTASFGQWTVDGERTGRGAGKGSTGGSKRSVSSEAATTTVPLGAWSGDYWAVWVEPAETSRNSRFAIWIEKDRINFRLYGAKGGESVPGMNREKQCWARAFVERGGRRFRRWRRLQATSTKSMCVAEWKE